MTRTGDVGQEEEKEEAGVVNYVIDEGRRRQASHKHTCEDDGPAPGVSIKLVSPGSWRGVCKPFDSLETVEGGWAIGGGRRREKGAAAGWTVAMASDGE